MTYCELPNVEECCGFGGTFSVKMPGTSLAMGRTKVENIVRSGAEVVVSTDISCLMHIGGILRRDPATRHIRTMHIAEVLVAGWENDEEIGDRSDKWAWRRFSQETHHEIPKTAKARKRRTAVERRERPIPRLLRVFLRFGLS